MLKNDTTFVLIIRKKMTLNSTDLTCIIIYIDVKSYTAQRIEKVGLFVNMWNQTFPLAAFILV